MLCAYLAAGVLTGLVLNGAFGLWWADPAVALAIAALAVKEGLETWRGEGCCAPSTIPTAVDCCDEDCCAGCATLNPHAPGEPISRTSSTELLG